MALPYETWMTEAQRFVVYKALTYLQTQGALPPDHQFYFTFLTHHPSVVIPDPLQKEYPKDMTIVLHQDFWNLQVTDMQFSVTLELEGHRYTLTIGYDALTAFWDPFAQFGYDLTPSAAFQSQENVISLDQFRQKKQNGPKL